MAKEQKTYTKEFKLEKEPPTPHLKLHPALAASEGAEEPSGNEKASERQTISESESRSLSQHAKQQKNRGT